MTYLQRTCHQILKVCREKVRWHCARDCLNSTCLLPETLDTGRVSLEGDTSNHLVNFIDPVRGFDLPVHCMHDIAGLSQTYAGVLFLPLTA